LTSTAQPSKPPSHQAVQMGSGCALLEAFWSRPGCRGNRDRRRGLGGVVQTCTISLPRGFRAPRPRRWGYFLSRRRRPDPRRARGLRAPRPWDPPGGVVQIGKIRNRPFLILPIRDMPPGRVALRGKIRRVGGSLSSPSASEPADGRARRDSQRILVFPFRTTPRRGRRGRRGRPRARRARPARSRWLERAPFSPQFPWRLRHPRLVKMSYPPSGKGHSLSSPSTTASLPAGCAPHVEIRPS